MAWEEKMSCSENSGSKFEDKRYKPKDFEPRETPVLYMSEIQKTPENSLRVDSYT